MKKTTFVKKASSSSTSKKKTTTFSEDRNTTPDNNTKDGRDGRDNDDDDKQTATPQPQQQQLHFFSTGLTEFDELFGGGIPSGAIVGLKEDANTTHYITLLRHFIAEGVVSGEGVVYIGASSCGSLSTISPAYVLSSLPEEIGTSSKGGTRDSLEEEEEEAVEGIEEQNKKKKSLKIAWRYEESKQLNETAKTQKRSSTSHAFDLSKKMKREKFEKHIRVVYCDEENVVEQRDDASRTLSTHKKLIDRVLAAVEALRVGYDARPVRIVLQSLGAPVPPWSVNESSIFLMALRSFVRRTPAVVGMVSVVPSAITDRSYRISSIVDAIVTLRSFAGNGEDVNDAFKDYSGFLYIEKLLRLGGLAFQSRPETLVYGFYKSRKRFVIEKLHLQPESKRFSSSQSEQPPILSELLCQPSLPSGDSILDF
eukprot:TRINITY_DN635_c0_g1_i3.p1 TRINITY_DN635_c0_g1~~TRINITY_DN635_c0_g1_i3.p1  ORF type:complete len:459 (+),score=142.53 TRINITY_DN635_c0_g1_i3:106-1377(+)